MKRKSDLTIENSADNKSVKYSKYNTVYAIRKISNNLNRDQITLDTSQTKSTAIKKIIEIIQNLISNTESYSDSSDEYSADVYGDMVTEFYESININPNGNFIKIFHNGDIVKDNTATLVNILSQTNTIKFGDSYLCIVKELHQMNKKQFEKKLMKKMEETYLSDFPSITRTFRIVLNKTTEQVIKQKFNRKIVYDSENKNNILGEIEIGTHIATIYSAQDNIDDTSYACKFNSPEKVISEIRRLRRYHLSYDLIQPKQFTKSNFDELTHLVLNPIHPFDSYYIGYEFAEIVIGYYHIKITKMSYGNNFIMVMYHGENEFEFKQWIKKDFYSYTSHYIGSALHIIKELGRLIKLDFMYLIPCVTKKTPNEIFKQLLDSNCNIEVIKFFLQNETIDPSLNNNYAIIWASMKGHLDLVKILAQDHRVNLTINNNAPIRYAMMHNHSDVVKFLIPKIDISKITDITILEIAKKLFYSM